MKTKRITFLLIMPLACLCLQSCSSDSDDETPNQQTETPETPEDNLSEEAKAFLGYWINQGNKGGDYIFWSDGTCWMYQFDRYGGHETEYHTNGYWTYDTSTKILATTTQQWQWQVTLSNPEAWTGISLGNSKTTYTFNKGDNLSFMKMIISESSWEESADSTMSLSNERCIYSNSLSGRAIDGYVLSGSLQFTQKYEIGNFQYNTGLVIKENDNPNDYTFDYQISFVNRPGTIATGVVTLKNPNSLKNQRLEFTGGINKTLRRSIQKEK